MGTVKYTGPVASFHCPTNAEIRSLKVHFSPKQEGSGDPSPENVRPIVGWDGCQIYKTGKNVGQVVGYNATNTNNADIHNDLTNAYGTTINTNNYNLPDTSLVITQTQAPNETTSYSYQNGYFAIMVKNLIYGQYYDVSFKVTNITNNLLNKNLNDIQLDVPSGGGGFPSQIIDNVLIYKNIKWSRYSQDPSNYSYNRSNFEIRNCGMSFTLSEFMVTPTGMNDGIFEPYQGSITDYEFGVLGKNKFDPNCDMWNYSVYTKNGDQITQSGSDGRGWTDSNFKSIPLKAGTYTLTCSDGNNFNIRTSIDNFQNNISLLNGGGTFTLTENCDIKIKHSTKLGNSYPTSFTIQLELGSAATAYEPYDPKHTVYGGWVDLISGEVREEWIKLTKKLSDCTSKTIYDNGMTYYNYNPLSELPCYANQADNTINGKYSKCSIAKHSWSSQTLITNHYYMFRTTDNQTRMLLYLLSDSVESDDTEFELAFQLAIPNIYYLTSTQLQTFLGQNNVWSNADYVEVEYDLHETQDILNRKAFIMANQPHIETTNGNIATFNTDMIAPIQGVKVYFNPIQEGSGDPSPTNVRPIIGKSDIDLYHTNKELYKCESGSIHGVTAEEMSSSSTMRSLGYIIVTPGHDYTFNLISSNLNAQLYRIYTYNSSNQLLGCSSEIRQTSFTTRIGAAYGSQDLKLRFTIKTSNNDNFTLTDILNTVIEVSDTSLTYSSSNPIPIDWTTEAGTVYGGYVDLVNREVVATHQIKILNGTENEWNIYQHPTYGDSFWIAQSGKKIEQLLSISDKYKNVAICYGKSGQDKYGVFCDHETLNRWYFRAPNNIVTTLNEWKEWLSQNNIIIAYQLATPITYQLTLAQLKTLRGTNNIWASNGGDNIEIKYWKH